MMGGKGYNDHYFHPIYLSHMGWKIISTEDSFHVKENDRYLDFQQFIVEKVKQLINNKYGNDALSRWTTLDNENRPSRVRGEPLTNDKKALRIAQEAFLLASIYHDTGFSYLVMQNIRNRILPYYLSLLKNSKYFVYFGDKEKEIVSKKTTNYVKMKSIEMF